MLAYTNNTERDSVTIEEKEKMLYILDKFASATKLYLKDYTKKVPVRFERVEKDQIKVYLPFDYRVRDKVVLYGFAKKYFQIELKFIKTLNIGRHLCEPVKTLIAKKERNAFRYPIEDKTIKAVSFDILKNDEDLLSSTVPMSLNMIIKDYENILSAFFPNVKIGTFDEDDRLVRLVRRTQKILFIEDTQNKDSYFIDNDEMIQYGEHIDENQLNYEMSTFEENNIKSLIVYPVIYHRFDDKEDIPLAYIKIWSEDELIEGPSALSLINFSVFEMIKKIQNALTTNIKINQSVLDISRKGIRMEVDSPSLIDHFSKSPEVVMELNFDVKTHVLKLAIRAEVVSTVKDGKGNLIVGMSFLAVEGKGFDKLEKYLRLWFERTQKNKKTKDKQELERV